MSAPDHAADFGALKVEARPWQNHGPSTVGATVDAYFIPLFECSGFGRAPEQNEAVARRAAACWNACKGVATEWLESEADGVVVLGEPLAGRFNAMEATIEQLRLAEEGAKTAFGHVVEKKQAAEREIRAMRGTIDTQQGVIQRMRQQIREAREQLVEARKFVHSVAPDGGLLICIDHTIGKLDK